MHDPWARSLAIALTFSFLLITGCTATKSPVRGAESNSGAPSGGGSGDTPSQLVYTVESNQVHAYSVAADGSLMLLQSNAWSAPGRKECLVTSKVMAAIYVCNYTNRNPGTAMSTVALLPLRADGTLGAPFFTERSTTNHFQQPVEDAAGGRAVLPFEGPCTASTDPDGYPVVCLIAARVFALGAGSAPQFLVQYKPFDSNEYTDIIGNVTAILTVETQADGSTAMWAIDTWRDHLGCSQQLIRHWFAAGNTSSSDSVVNKAAFEGNPCPGYAVAPPHFTQIDNVDAYGDGQLNLYELAGSGAQVAQGPACSVECSVQFLSGSRILVVDQSTASLYTANSGDLQLLNSVVLPPSTYDDWHIGAIDQTESAGVFVSPEGRHLVTFNVGSDDRIALGTPFITAAPVSALAMRSR